ncbi:two-component sensor histidine kinase BarA [Dongshaea marina]|uniref:two-component sensor histidine kinase BarA n=1 Tax=Dongshaea marina TaxID=2047966 RepID=UPI000D3E32B5|nr:two-component sensor histidine kinase BarA [Dongshaea marina]
MTKYGLRARVVTLTILPTLVIGILMAGYFTFHRYQQLEHNIIQQGINVIEPLAIASEYGMEQRAPEHLKRLINLAHRQNSPLIDAIAIFTKDNKLFITSNYHRDYIKMRQPKGKALEHFTTVQRLGETLILRTPILEDAAANNGVANLSRAKAPILGYISIEINTDKVLLLQYRDAIVSVLIVLLGLLLSAFSSLKLFRGIIQPISNMVNAVYQIRKGKLETRIRGEFSGELDTLKNGINAMAKSISEYHEEMQLSIDQATSDLRETLEQMEIQNVELALAKKKAQEAARVKSEFLANISHELRTPLNGVMGFTRQLLKTPLGAGQKDYLQIIERSARNLLNIINDILDLSKLEAHKLTLELIPFSLRETTDEVMSLLAPGAQEKGLELTVQIDPQVCDAVTGDPLRYQQIITNLISNAIKFTERGNIVLTIQQLKMVSERKARLSFQVMDTGIGISPEQQSLLFRPFNQADSSITRRHGGTGLGLAITQHLIQLMGGEISINSSQGKGSTFTFTLEMSLNALPSRTQLSEGALAGQSILLFERDPYTQRAMTEQLQSWGGRVAPCNQPADWQDSLKLAYSTIIIGQSQSDDLQYTFEQLEQATSSCTKVLLLLNSGDPNLSEKALAMGATGCLTKPFNHRKLAQLMQGHPDLPGEVQPQRPVSEQPQPTTTTPYWDLRVLAVDDNLANLKLISAILEDHVREVVSCSSARDAIDKATHSKFDLIFMDIQMPEIDGLNATLQIREHDRNKETPVIAVTAHTFSEEKALLLREGMDDYLAKPIDERALQKVIERFCGPATRIQAPKQVEAPEPEPQLRSASEPQGEHSTLSWALALERAAGKPDLAKEMLEMLYEQMQQFIPELQDAMERPSEAKDFQALVHKLHGGCAYSGVPRLQRLLYTLESALKQGELLNELEPELLELEDILNQTISAARQQLAKLTD